MSPLAARLIRAALSLLLAAASACAPEPRPPNLLLVSIDSLRADHLGVYGYGRDTSPRIDRLARNGVLFEDFIAESSWTLPSHMTLLTGLPSLVHGVVFDGVRLDPARVTLAEHLGEAGYRSAAVVAALYLDPLFGFDRGFERYEVVGPRVPDEEGFFARVHDDQATAERWATIDASSHRGRSNAQVLTRAWAALDDLGADPFFLFVHFWDVHYDYDPPESYWRRFDPDWDGDLDPRDYIQNPAVHADMDPRDLAHVVARYDGEIRWTDEHVGMLLDALDRKGLADDTLVVVTSDHGDEFFEHGGKGHRYTLYDEQLRVPLVMRWPGRLPAGRRVATQAAMAELVPTLLDLMGVEPMAEAGGRSLRPWIEGAATQPGRLALSYLYWPDEWRLRSLRQGDRKLIQRIPAGSRQHRTEVFDLARDPGEQEDLGTPGEAELSVLQRAFRAQREARDALPSSADRAVDLPDAMRQQLEAMGYLDAGP